MCTRTLWTPCISYIKKINESGSQLYYQISEKLVAASYLIALESEVYRL